MSPSLERRPLGNTGEQVTVISLGGSPLDNYSLADGVATVHCALELGINYFDTAPVYGSGASQVIYGRALEGRKESYLLATKLGSSLAPAAHRSLEILRAQVWDNLRVLRRKSVDVLQAHVVEHDFWWHDGPTPNRLLDLNSPCDFAGSPIMQVLREARDQGLCRFIGITADSAPELIRILNNVEVDTCLLAYGYNMLYRHGLRTLLPITLKRGIAYLNAGIFQPALIRPIPEWLETPPEWLSPEVFSRLPRLYRLQKDSGLSLVAMGVRYLISDAHLSTIIVGAGTPAEIEESVLAAMDGPLPPDLQQAIDALGLP
jgi:L-galactose dehydrogenase